MTKSGGVKKHITPAEFELFHEAARRRSHRDATMLLLAYRHGLRSCELVALQWSDIDLTAGTIHVRRAKGSTDSTHYLQGDELRALRKLENDSPYVFKGQRGPMTPRGFRNVCEAISKDTGVHLNSHALRHGCGYRLANAGRDTRSLQGYLGHKNIQHTVRYTELSPLRFRDFWK